MWQQIHVKKELIWKRGINKEQKDQKRNETEDIRFITVQDWKKRTEDMIRWKETVKNVITKDSQAQSSSNREHEDHNQVMKKDLWEYFINNGIVGKFRTFISPSMKITLHTYFCQQQH